MVCPCRFPRLLGRKSETSSRRLELVADFLETSPRQIRDSLFRVCLEEVAVMEFGIRLRDVSSLSRGSRCSGIWPLWRHRQQRAKGAWNLV
jgi:hypothetical protein